MLHWRVLLSCRVGEGSWDSALWHTKFGRLAFCKSGHETRHCPCGVCKVGSLWCLLAWRFCKEYVSRYVQYTTVSVEWYFQKFKGFWVSVDMFGGRSCNCRTMEIQAVEFLLCLSESNNTGKPHMNQAYLLVLVLLIFSLVWG